MSVYEQDGITIHHARCEDVLPTLERVDHVITDPPFETEAHTLQRRAVSGVIVDPGDLPFAPITEQQRMEVATAISSLARRWVLTFCQIEASPLWRMAYENGGLVYKRTCLWIKPDGMPQYSGDRPGMGYETLIAMHAAGKSRWNGGGRHGVFVVNKGENGGRPNSHPTQKPLRLMTQLIELFTDPGDVILDPFMGSGTTLVAAKMLGRRAIGIEMNADYCETAIQRLQQSLLPLHPPAVATQTEISL